MSEIKLTGYEIANIKRLEACMVVPNNRIIRIRERMAKAVEKGNAEIADIESQNAGFLAMIQKIKDDAAIRQEEENAIGQGEVLEGPGNDAEIFQGQRVDAESFIAGESATSNEDVNGAQGEAGEPFEEENAPSTWENSPTVEELFNED